MESSIPDWLSQQAKALWSEADYIIRPKYGTSMITLEEFQQDYTNREPA